MVFPSCSNGVDDMFEPMEWDFKQYVADCINQYGVAPRYEWPTIYYAGKALESFSNILFTNGGMFSYQ